MGYSFLLVDDSAIIRKAVSKALVLADVGLEQLYEAADGREALEVLRSGKRVDLVFLDVNMPVMNGIEFLAEVRSDPALCKTRVVLLSTEGGTQRLDEIDELGIQGKLRKPVRPETLAEVVQQILETTM